jgi:hypothetical protein
MRAFLGIQAVFINKSKIHFESKSQPFTPAQAATAQCLSINQRYILKANHNKIVKFGDVDDSVYQ